ncbi:F-box-like protein [Rhizoctonia solani]|uniref:F-box-like protein n=1 Tax=Rhizoctonia solani TaxID=456999 RepID=A0A8H8P6D8_9AGAM|nr:F-box-like protein [Rhizoctonia solani]QRW24638.1 F-box-like protein [Rhizoctonia solani]
MKNDQDASFSEQAREKREQQNKLVWINRFPNEILSRIFVIGEEMDQDKDDSEDQRDKDDPVLQFQELVAQVCRKWREIAVNMPMVRPSCSEYDQSQLIEVWHFSSGQRSGKTIPLEIEIDVLEHLDIDSWSETSDNPSLELKLVLDALNFLDFKGAKPFRWARLAIWFEKPRTFFAIVDLLIDASLSNLRKLTLVNTDTDTMVVEDFVVEAMRERNLSNSVLFRTPPPLLRELELVGVPSNFFFPHESTSLVVNLTRLDLGFLLYLPPLMCLRSVLLHNPRLESLCLDTGMIETTNFEHKNATETRVRMPFLRRFSLQEPISVEWGLSVLQMIDAPELEALALNLDRSESLADPIPFYIAYGKGFNGEEVPPKTTDMRPIYPTLKHLALGPFTGTSLSLLAMLGSLRTITRLDWELQEQEPITINQALEDHKICQGVEHIRVYGVHELDLADLVESRIRNGAPFKTVEVNSRDWRNFSEPMKAKLSDELRLAKFRPYVDDNESDSDTSTDSDSGYSDSDSSSDSGDWTDTDSGNADDHEDS